jgi:regulatory protein
MSESIVEWKPCSRDRVFIKLSGGRFFTVPAAETRTLETGATLSDEDIEKLSRIDQYFRGKDKAIRLLALSPRSRWEIKRALDGIGLTQAIRDGVLLDLEERGLIDDVRFAREFVRNQIELKFMGPHRLRFTLKKRGVSASIVDDVLSSEVTDQGQEAAAWRLVRKKIGAKQPNDSDIRRLSGMLRRKGLDYEIINRVLYRLLEESRQATFEDDE